MYYHKEEREEFIRYLADKFPKCFFDDPSHRRPLKRNILDDLDKQKVLGCEKLTQALDWYQNHFVYRYGLIAGAERVDLDGNKAGTVTPLEQQEARAGIEARKRELKERRIPATPITNKGHELNGHPMTKTTANGSTASLHPSLAEVQAAISIVSSILTEERYEPLRPALAATALREIIGKAEKLISSLQHGQG